VNTTVDARSESGRRLSRDSVALLAHGEPAVWLMGGGLVLALAMILGLLVFVFYQGVSTLWPRRVERITLRDGRVHMGEVTRDDRYRPSENVLASLPEAVAAAARAELAAADGWAHRRLLRTGNYELTGEHFQWISDYQIAAEEYPPWAVVLERMTWGRFYGMPVGFQVLHYPDEFGDQPDLAERRRLRRTQALQIARELGADPARRVLIQTGPRMVAPEELPENAMVTAVVEVWEGAESAWDQFLRWHAGVRERWRQRRSLEKFEIGRINQRKEIGRRRLRAVELRLERMLAAAGPDAPAVARVRADLEQEREAFGRLDRATEEEFIRVRARIAALNRENSRFRLVMATADGASKTIELAEIVRGYPANRLTFAQRLALYGSRWREFLLDDPREANMEGGVFPAIFGTVVMTLVMSLVVVPFGVLAALYLREYAKAGPLISAVRIAVNNLAGVPSIVFGVFGLGFFCYFVGGHVDQWFFASKLPSPTYGTGGILWASLTLALMTLPVVIVATEEALAAVPGSMREGSYACGASKWQTIRRIVLPRAMPGIMTGMILAMARGAGEVAPLMLVGAVKMAPELPVDSVFPYLHPERSFMHLGFHIYDLGFQSQNSEAAKPMVFTTTLLLIAIIAALNVAAVVIRTRLRRRFHSGTF